MKNVKLVSNYNAQRNIRAFIDYDGQIEFCDSGDGLPAPMPAQANDLVTMVVTVADAVATAMQSDVNLTVIWIEDVINVA